jgi:hypothetical protein
MLALASCAQPGGGSLPGGAATLVAPAPKQTAVLRPAPNPAGLLGKPAAVIEAALGTPAFKGRDGEAHIWRYSADKCNLLVILYEDDSGTAKAAHLDARQPEGGEAAMGPCLSDIVNAPSA